MRGPQDEERGISTPRVSQEKPPSPSLPRKRGGQAPAFFPGEPRPLACGRPRRPPGSRPSPPRLPARAKPAGSRPQGAARVARINGATLRGARGRREAGSRAESEFRDRK